MTIKTSAVSELVEPNINQKNDYLKYSLMYARTFYCKGDINSARKFKNRIDKIGEATYSSIPGYKDKLKQLNDNLNDQVAIGRMWIRFVDNNRMTLDELKKYESAKYVCEKGTLARYYYMLTHAHYCNGEVEKAKDYFDGKTPPSLLQLVDKTSFKAASVKGMTERVNKFRVIFKTLNKLDIAWASYMKSGNSPGFKDNLPLIECYPIPNMKVHILNAATNYCENGSEELEKIEKLNGLSSHTIPDDLNGKINWLRDFVNKNNKDLAQLNKIWGAFAKSNKVDPAATYEHTFPCNREAEVKAYILDGFIDPCKYGQAALDSIARIQKDHKPSLSVVTKDKLGKLKGIITKEAGNIAVLNKAWTDFVPDDKLSNGINFVFEYCDKVAQIKAYIMDGTVNMCAKAKERLADIQKVRDEFNPELDEVVLGKIENLQKSVDKSDQDLADLNTAWKLFVDTDKEKSWSEGFPQKDTLIRDSIRLVDFYCDKIAQTKSWAIKGHLDPCETGEGFLTKIDALKAKHSLKYDTELTCRVQRLRSKVYQCKYWELVLKARKITHEEREEFGPKSAELMKVDLNGEKQPCETGVVYEPLGFIGVKYVISTYMCQKINLAKMGDPEYYKKIATWVNTEVLDKYCEADMRCKKDFFIYLEGHTDGYRFNGRKYDRSLDIAEGTAFTHFLGKKNGAVDTIQKTTRNITSSLKNNMELGIARAWTVKEQLNFMNVPIRVGAYEHPENEKGGEFRKIDIELNITNLLLDFYEKTLKNLIKESGIGDRPKAC